MVWAAVVRVAVCGEAQRKKGEGRDVPEGTLGSLERAAKRRCWLGRDSQKEKNGHAAVILLSHLNDFLSLSL